MWLKKRHRGIVKPKAWPVYFLTLTPFALFLGSMVAFDKSPVHVPPFFLPFLFIFIAAAILTWLKRFYFYATWSVVSFCISIHVVRMGFVDAEKFSDIEDVFSLSMGAILLLGGLIVFIAYALGSRNLESPLGPSKANNEQEGIEQ